MSVAFGAYGAGGTIFKSYRVREFLGRGTFGRVYGVAGPDGGRYALKVLHPGIGIDREGLDAVRAVRSGNLVGIIDAGETVAGEPCLLMEHAGESLGAVLERGGMDEARARLVFQGILEGLMVLEAHEILHRDLKPGNIFLADGRVRIGDHGTDRYLSGETAQGSADLESVRYMAPERFSDDYGSSADRWSAAVLLCRMLSGTPPFGGTEIAQVFHSIRKGDPDLDGVPKPYRPFLRKSFRKEAAQRHRSAGEMLSAFQGTMSGGAARWGRVVRTGGTRNRLVPAAAVALLLAVLLAAHLSGGRILPFWPFGEKRYPLTVPTEPADARVRLSGAGAVYTPGVALPPGTYDVVVSRPGYETQRLSVEIVDRPVVIDPVSLERTTHRLFVETTPADAVVRLPDIEAAYEPGVRLPPGRYRVAVSRPGYLDRSAWAEIGREDTTLRVDLEKRRYGLTVRTTPGDAEVRLPEIDADYTPGMLLAPGRYRIEVSRKGYGTRREWIEVGEGDSVHQVALTPQKEGTFRLTVRPTPEDAVVKIMNIRPVYEPGMALEPGRYLVQVSRGGYGTHSRWVDLRDRDLSIDVDLKKLPDPVVLPEGSITLRRTPMTAQSKNQLGIREVDNDFADTGRGVVVDRTTGLMWEKAGSGSFMDYREARSYVAGLNRRKLAGYGDWRLPTMPELGSLLEGGMRSTGFYMSPIFGNPTRNWYWCWSADRRSSSAVWGASFRKGYVSYLGLHSAGFVRAVRGGG